MYYRTLTCKFINCESEEECRKRSKFQVEDWYDKNNVYPVLSDITILNKNESVTRVLMMAPL